MTESSVSARPAATTAAAAASVEISISATPPTAKIFIDEKPLAGNPAKTTVAKDALAHQVRIEAPGYAAKVDSITFERDRTMDVELVKSASVDAQPHHAAGGPAPPVDDLLRPTKKPQRTLDTSNPYQQ